MKKNTITIRRRELYRLEKLYEKDMAEINEMYRNGEINYQDRGALKLYVWSKTMYLPLAAWKRGDAVVF